MKQLIDPKYDFAFKQLFGQPRNADLLMALLNALLKRSENDRITSLEYRNVEQPATHGNDKSTRLDVFVETQAGERIDIEIQVSPVRDMPERTLFYWPNCTEAKGAAVKPMLI